MLNLLATRWGRLAAFFMLYVTEGIPLGFTATAIASEMRRRGVGAEAIGGFVATLYLPWAFKWAAGPIVDLFYVDRVGRRRGWILMCQLGMSLTLLAAMPIDFAARLQLFTIVILAHNCFSAVQDVAIDALAVSVVPARERGLANGVMFAGAYAGNGIGGAGVLFLAPFVGFNATVPFVIGALLAMMVLVALTVKGPRPPPLARLAGVTGSSPDRARLLSAALEVRSYAVTAAKAMVGSRGALAGLVF